MNPKILYLYLASYEALGTFCLYDLAKETSLSTPFHGVDIIHCKSLNVKWYGMAQPQGAIQERASVWRKTNARVESIKRRAFLSHPT